MEAILDWTSGISWTMVYLISIYLGLRKKTHCIPAICVCLNFSWELLVVLVRVAQRSPLNSGFVSQLLWFILDVGVLYTWFRHAQEVHTWKKWALLVGAAVAMAAATLGAGFWAQTAFVINLVMSAAFLFRIGGRVYPSLSIAILKCLGTLPATILNGILHRDYLILTVGGLCLIADFCYIHEVWMHHKQDTNLEQT